jgi:hypothetical protein
LLFFLFSVFVLCVVPALKSMLLITHLVSLIKQHHRYLI